MRRIRTALAAVSAPALGAALLAVVFSVATPPASAQSDDRFVIGVDGLGPVTRDAVVTLDDVRAAYPELSVVAEPFYAEGERYERIVARDGRAIVFTVELDEGRFRDITAYSPMITDVYGARVGEPLADLPAVTARLCVLMADGSPYVACASVDDAKLQYLFDSAPNVPRAGDPLKAIRVWR